MKLYLFPALLAALLVAVHYSLRKEYTVHTAGAVLVSGASSGIGRDAAVRLAAAGYTVFAGVRKSSDAEKLLNSKVPNLLPVMLDVTDHASCAAAIRTVSQHVEDKRVPFVGLVNNAGISRRGIAEFHSLEDARAVFDTNVFGLIDLTQLALPLLRKSRGRIVMISSIAGFFAPPGSSIYAASKFAVEGFTDALRREVSSFGISISIVEPGYVQTNIFDKSVLSLEDAAQNTASPEVVRSLYTQLVSEQAAAKRAKNLANAHSTECTSDAIMDAIASPHPRTRYPVAGAQGLPAQAIAAMTYYLSDVILDGVFVRT